VTGRAVSVRASEGALFGAYLALPSKVPAPGIVILQEIFGLSGFVRTVCEDFAQAGYVVMAPDLFWRQQANVQLDSENPADRALAMKYLQGLDERLAVEDAAQTLAQLRTFPECTGKAGAVGFCLGGKLAYLMAARTDVNAAVAYYGVGIHEALGEAANLRAPLLLHIAADDQLCKPQAQKEIIRALESVPQVTIHVHKGAGHAFARKGSSAYQAITAITANDQSAGFLERYLR
jgi:carboxymethylenebutenolidase